MPFKPAKNEVLRSFVILDSEMVLSGLAALDGGAVDQVLTRTTEDGASQLSGQIGVRGAKAGASKNRGRKVQEELTRRRTEHSAAATLIDRLTELEAIGEVDGAMDEDVAGLLTPGDTIRVKGELVLHPIHQADATLRSYLEAAPIFDGNARGTARELRKILPVWEAMVGAGRSAQVLFDLITTPDQKPRIVIPAKRSALQVEMSEIGGFSTVLAKVDRIVGPDDQAMALRVLRNAPVSEVERTAIEEAAVDLVAGFAEIGIPCTADDVVMRGPLVMLRPLCVWR